MVVGHVCWPSLHLSRYGSAEQESKGFIYFELEYKCFKYLYLNHECLYIENYESRCGAEEVVTASVFWPFSSASATNRRAAHELQSAALQLGCQSNVCAQSYSQPMVEDIENAAMHFLTGFNCVRLPQNLRKERVSCWGPSVMWTQPDSEAFQSLECRSQVRWLEIYHQK